MERITVAYWINGLGEECSSRVHAEYSHGGRGYVVVHDWRKGARGHGFIVLERNAALVIRKETLR